MIFSVIREITSKSIRGKCYHWSW